MLISNFKVVVVGMGVQGQKRAKIAKNDLIATVDVDTNKADYKCIEQIDDNSYHAVLLCTPDNVKYELLKKLLYKNKHVLVEKPLFVNNLFSTILLIKIFIFFSLKGGSINIISNLELSICPRWT